MLPITALVLLCIFRNCTLAMSAGGGEPALSASAIVAPAVSGSHIIRIDGYSLNKGLGNGKYIASEAFAVGGHRWRLLYYPDSLGSNHSDWVSVMLHLDHTEPDELKAKFTMSLLDRDGRRVPSYSKTSPLCGFTGGQSGQCLATGYELIKRSELEGSAYLKDDCFSVRCDVTVADEFFTKAIPVPDPSSSWSRQAGGMKWLLLPIIGCLLYASALLLVFIATVLECERRTD